jgi:hypothetical protein
MIVIDDRFMNFGLGWIVEYKDGTCVYEGEVPWSKVVKRSIKSLCLKHHEKMWSISGKENYLQFNRSFVTFAPAGFVSDPVILERCIGYYDEKGRKVIYRVNEQTGQMRLDVKEG